MEFLSVNRFQWLTICCILVMITGCSSSSQNCLVTGNCGDTELLSVVAISRHGIRSPTSSQATINLYTRQPAGFPVWPLPSDVPDLPGTLTTKGQQNAALLGAWYRDFYAAQGILPARGTCPAPGTVYVYADVFERTLHTAQGYLDGMFLFETTPDCGIQVVKSIQSVDPYIDTAAAGVCGIDIAEDLTAFNVKIGGNSTSLINTYSAQLQTLQTVTQCCQPAACASPANPTPTSCSLLQLPTTATTSGEVAFATGTLFDVADTVTETLELEYAQGMPETGCGTNSGAECVGWGAIPANGLSDLTKLHVLNMVNLTCQLPSFAQVGSTNLMSQLVGTMDQAVSGVKNADILAPVESKFTLFVAHDENVSAIAKFLGGVTWQAEGFQPNDPNPAGALVFELHKIKQSGELVVRLYYVIATLDQMRSSTTLTLQTPPQRLPLAIPACGGNLDCPYDQLKKFINAHVRKDCIVTAASAAAQ
jgi:4-phytase/acid phosphatase